MLTKIEIQRVKLQIAIFNAVRNFEDSTDHVVQKVELTKLSMNGDGQTVNVIVFTVNRPGIPGDSII